MEWRDQGILLSARRHGESSSIIEMFTPTQGRHVGVVRGGTSRKIAPILQPGAQLDVMWRARLEEHIGSFTVEPVRSRAAVAMADRMTLAGLNTVTAMLSFCLPEREPYADLYERTVTLLDMLEQQEVWPLAYLHWELRLLEDMGFALDLERCAVTGATQELRYVSPKSGRAVSVKGAGEWADRLLPLPPVLRGMMDADPEQVAQGFITTGYFLDHHLAKGLGNNPLPEARVRYVEAFNRQR